MSLFPFFTEIGGKRCRVGGGGAVARRKAEALIEFGAAITLVAPAVDEELKINPAVTVRQRQFREEDFEEDWAFVIAASDDPAVNARVAALCDLRRIPVNRADEPGRAGFVFPALIKRGDLTIGISTGASSPRAAGFLRRLIEGVLPEKTEEILSYLGSARERIKGLLNNPKEKVQTLSEIGQGLLFLSSSRLWITFCSKRI